MKTYYFVDRDGTEGVSNRQPFRHLTEPFWVTKDITKEKGFSLEGIVELPKGTIETLFNVKLTWDDKPIMVNN